MPKFFARVIPAAASVAQGLADAAEMGSSILMNGDKRKKLTPRNSIASYLLGAITGIVTGITYFFFQGKEAEKRLLNITEYDSETEEELVPFENQLLTFKRKSSYLLVKYGYISTALVIHYLAIEFLYSATRAWIQDLTDGKDTPLTPVSHTEALLLFLYYLLLDLPMILTTSIPQTCRGISNMLDVLPHQAPDSWLMDKFRLAMSPIASSSTCRKFIRRSGTGTDTLEHILPLVIIIPPSWILRIVNSPAIVAWSAAGLGVVVLSIVSGTMLTQTYFFEGKFSDQNLRRIANQFGVEVEDDEPWVTPRISSIFDKLLNLGGPLKGIDNGLSISLTLKEWNAPTGLVLGVTTLFFGASCAGGHLSEVKKAQDELKAITLPRESKELRDKVPGRTLFFASGRNYGALNDDVVLDVAPEMVL